MERDMRLMGWSPSTVCSEKQAAAGISGASLLKQMALPQERVLAQGMLF